MEKLFAVSDVHGFYTILKENLEAKGFDLSDPEHVLLINGDLFDRGDEAIELFEFVKKLNDKGRLIYIRGNHEDLLLDAMEEIKVYSRVCGDHHYSNGTVDTIAQFTGDDDIAKKLNGKCVLTESEKEFVNERLVPVLKFIDDNTVSYYEFGTYIFTHGWLPCTFFHYFFETDFSDICPNWRDLDRDGIEWRDARWYNGGRAWQQECYIGEKTIVCGHFHCSWGHANIHRDRKEWPDKSRKNWRESFETFFDKGIIMMDACTAYSGMMNVLAFKIQFDEKIIEDNLVLINN